MVITITASLDMYIANNKKTKGIYTKNRIQNNNNVMIPHHSPSLTCIITTFVE